MKKTLIKPLITVIVLVLVAALFLYFFLSLNRLDKKIIAQQAAISQNSTQINSIVNFFNSNLNAQNSANSATK